MKLHLYPAGEITRSVLASVPITAICGMEKVLTREDIDAAVNESRKVCKACTGAVAERALSEDVAIRRRATWAQHLEREAIAAMPLRWTVSTSTVRTWDYTGTWGGRS